MTAVEEETNMAATLAGQTTMCAAGVRSSKKQACRKLRCILCGSEETELGDDPPGGEDKVMLA